MHDWISQARIWVAGDPDPETRAELEQLIAAAQLDELADRMGSSLKFGTAGIRGTMGAGSNRMNRATVIRVARGLADHLLDRFGGAPSAPVVVGRDARLRSGAFMDDMVAVLVAAGIGVRYWPQPIPTPLLAFAVREFEACAGVMVTASHNPPRDNGLKVYDAGGAQIVPPVDASIADAIGRVGPASDVPRLDPAALTDHRSARQITDRSFEEYRRRLHARRGKTTEADPGLRIVYTPLHGVGWRYLHRLLEDAGYPDVHPVVAQMDPDGTFPTLPFPNPEEPGAMDLALALGDEVDADLVLANDPDADRLGVSVPSEQGWVKLTGNQLGVLLIDHILAGTRPAMNTRQPLVIGTIVSSPMAKQVALAHGARYETTLTGFKWIMKAAREIEASGGGSFVFGFEEALGYALGGLVNDKDGLSAAVLIADLASACRRRGETIADHLTDLYRRHGVWVSVQRSIRRPGPEGARWISTAMRRLGSEVPDQLGGMEIWGITDYRAPSEERPPWLGVTDLIVIEMGEGSRILARPSGTEPKLKIYVDATRPVKDGEDPSRIHADLVKSAEAAVSDLVEHLRA